MSTPMLELWQTEWCPWSHRVRQRLTELGLPFVARQVPVEHGERRELRQATGATTIPVLVADGEAIVGAQAIIAFLDERHAEPAEAARQRAKAREKDVEARSGALSTSTTLGPGAAPVVELATHAG